MIAADLKLAVAYARVSTKDQERTGHTLPIQSKNMQEYSQGKGLQIVKEFVVAESASKKDRRHYGEMWEFLARHKGIKHIIFEEIDRFTRNDKDKVDLLDKVNDGGYVAHFVLEKLTLDKETSPNDIFLFDILVAKAKNYSAALSLKVKKGQLGKLEKGGYPGSCATYGYKKKNGEIVSDPASAPVVKLIFQWCDQQHLTLKEIADDLNDQGFRTRSGKHFRQNFVHSILTDPTYYGMMKWKGKLFPGSHEVFIDKACFDRVEEWLSRKHPVHGIIHNFTYRGFMKCGECGCAITADTHKHHVYYHCTRYHPCSQKRSMREEWVEGEIIKVLDNLHLGPKAVSVVEEKILSNRDQEDGVKKMRVEDLKEQLVKMIEWVDRTYDDKMKGIIDEAMYLRKSQDYTKRKEEISQALQNLEKINVNNSEVSINVLNLADRASEIYKRRLPEEKRRLLNFLLSYAVLKDENLDLTLRIPFNYITQYRKSGNWSG